MRCLCRYILATNCDGPGSPPTVYVTLKALEGIVTEKWFGLQTKDGFWCYSIDPSDPSVCETPANAVIIRTLGSVTLYDDCDCALGDPHAYPRGYVIPGQKTGDPILGGTGGTPVPGNTGNDGTGVPALGIEGTPCDDTLDNPPEVWGVILGTTTGSVVYRVGRWCYSFDLTDTPTTIPGTAMKIWLTNNDQTCEECVFGIPVEYCGRGGASNVPLFVHIPDAPATEMFFVYNGACVRFDPDRAPEVVPATGRFVTPRDEYTDCEDCDSGIISTPCSGQDSNYPKLWVREPYIPLEDCVDRVSGYLMHFNAEGTRVAKPANYVDYIPRRDFETCDDARCGVKRKGKGKQWYICPTFAGKEYVKNFWSIEEDIPDLDTAYFRVINNVPYYMPAGPLHELPNDARIIAVIAEYEDCIEAIDDGSNFPTDPDDDDDNDRPDDDQDGDPDADEDEDEDGTPDGPPGGPGTGGENNGGEDDSDDGNETPNSYCQEHKIACYNKTRDCFDGSILNCRMPNIKRGSVAHLNNDECFESIAHNGDLLPSCFDAGQPLEGLAVAYTASSCTSCKPPKRCYTSWRFQCDPPTMTYLATYCSDSDLSTDWVPDGDDFIKFVQGGVCNLTSHCQTPSSDPPLAPPANPTHLCPKDCYVQWKYDCQTEAITVVSKTCTATDLTSDWTLVGEHFYKTVKGATCSVDGDCVDGTTPSPPVSVVGCANCACPGAVFMEDITISPDGSVEYFNGGAPLPAGNYRLCYLSGGYFHTPSGEYTLGDETDFETTSAFFPAAGTRSWGGSFGSNHASMAALEAYHRDPANIPCECFVGDDSGIGYMQFVLANGDYADYSGTCVFRLWSCD